MGRRQKPRSGKEVATPEGEARLGNARNDAVLDPPTSGQEFDLQNQVERLDQERHLVIQQLQKWQFVFDVLKLLERSASSHVRLPITLLDEIRSSLDHVEESLWKPDFGTTLTHLRRAQAVLGLLKEWADVAFCYPEVNIDRHSVFSE